MSWNLGRERKKMRNQRVVEYDIMRIIACFCVIMIHSAVFEQESMYVVQSSEFLSIKFWGVIARWSVPAFVMLSGMLILPHADKISIKRLFVHRVLRMLVAYVTWSVVYSFYNTYILGNVYAPTKFKTFIDGCFSGELHMWYLPMLAGLYIAAPILIIIIENISGKWMKYWIGGMFVFSSLIPFIEKLNVKYVSTIISSISGYMNLQFLGGWTLYFVLGYYISHTAFTKKQVKVIYCCTGIAFLFTFITTVGFYRWYGESMGILSYEYPNIIILGVGVFLLFKEKISKISFTENYKQRIYSLSKLTFGIYLIHVLVLKILYQFGLSISIFHPIISVPIVALATFIFAALLIWIVRKIPVIGTYVA